MMRQGNLMNDVRGMERISVDFDLAVIRPPDEPSLDVLSVGVLAASRVKSHGASAESDLHRKLAMHPRHRVLLSRKTT